MAGTLTTAISVLLDERANAYISDDSSYHHWRARLSFICVQCRTARDLITFPGRVCSRQALVFGQQRWLHHASRVRIVTALTASLTALKLKIL